MDFPDEAIPAVPEHLKMPYLFRIQARNQAGQMLSQLDRPVRLTFDFGDLSYLDWGQTFVQLFYFDDSSRQWVRVPAQTDMANRRIVADVAHFTDFGFGGDANTLPSTPPNLEGFSVDQCTGYSQASINLKVPPGIGGLAPAVALHYNCGSTDMLNQYWIADGNPTAGTENARTRLQASPVGLGWQLDFGAVFRSPETDPLGHPIFYMIHGNRSFELAYVDGTTFRTKPDDFMRVRKLTGAPNDCASHEYWLIETKDGTQYRYGYNADSEQRAGRWQFGEDGVQKAWQWSLDQVQDLHGNTVSISYTEVSAQPPAGFDDTLYHDQSAHPSSILYTANSGQGFAANREVRFTYSSRTDAVAKTSDYAQFYWTKKLDRVEM